MTFNTDEPTVSILDLDSDGVTLVSLEDRTVADSLVPKRVKGYDRLLPFTVSITNNTEVAIEAYTVEWVCTSRKGQVTKPRRVVMDFSPIPPGIHFAPHSRQVVSLSVPLEAGGTTWNEHAASSVNTLAKNMSEQGSIVISLDAVLFADGVIVRPDNAHTSALWRAWLDGQKQISKEIGSKQTTADKRKAIVTMTQPTMDAVFAKVGRPIAYTELQILIGRTELYEDALPLVRTYLALSLLAQLDRDEAGTS